MTFKDLMERKMMETVIANSDAITEENYHHIYGKKAIFKVGNTAAQHEKAIVKFLQLHGHMGAKVSTQGTFREGESYETAAGHTLRAKSFFQPTGGRLGAADISASIYGVAVHFELKYSKGDRQSPQQKKFEDEVIASGGHYLIVKNVEDFYRRYLLLMEHPQIVLMKDYTENNGKA
jgi:hypothetical protein